MIAGVVGFEVADINDEDRFISDYRITYSERKVLLEKLNADFGKAVEFAVFCKLDRVDAVIKAFTH